jgi:hypothetical protein
MSSSKNSKKTLIPTVLLLLFDFLSLKNSVNVDVGLLKFNNKNRRIRIDTKMSWISNTDDLVLSKTFFGNEMDLLTYFWVVRFQKGPINKQVKNALVSVHLYPWLYLKRFSPAYKVRTQIRRQQKSSVFLPFIIPCCAGSITARPRIRTAWPSTT